MTIGGHARQTPDKGIHVSISWTFANAAARTAFTPTSGIPTLEAQLTSADLGKFAWQLDSNDVYILVSLGPTVWSAVGGGGVPASRTITAGDGLTGGGDLTLNRTFDVVANPDGSIVVNADDIQVGVLATDAQHGDRGGGSLHSDATTSVSGFMSDTDKTKLDGISEGAAALTDVDSPLNVDATGSDVGVGTTAARWDHKHEAVTDTAVEITDSTNGAGTADALARADHLHAHGDRGGGTLHAVATTSVDGFLSATDKTKLDGVATGAAALTSSAPVDVTKAAAVVGVATTAARADHKHDVSTAAPGSTGVATASGEGSASTLARSDHTHQSNTAPVAVTKAAAAIGTSGEPARADHKHDVSTAAPGATGVATASGEGSASTLARSDHTHQSNTAPVNVTKATAAIGTSGEPARADHKHDVSTAAPAATGVATASGEGSASTLARSDHTHQSNTAPVNVTKSAAAIGTSGEPARADHKHDVSTATAVDLTDSTNAEGSATTLARSDHTHAHGTRGGGTLHSVVTTSTAGFMAAADKSKLDRVGDISSFSTGTASTSGGTPVTKTSIVIPAENETFIIEASLLVELSNTTANGGVRLYDTTSSTSLATRVFNSEMADSENILSAILRVEFVQTVGAGAQTVAIQYYIASGTGTVTVSDALITARRKL